DRPVGGEGPTPEESLVRLPGGARRQDPPRGQDAGDDQRHAGGTILEGSQGEVTADTRGANRPLRAVRQGKPPFRIPRPAGAVFHYPEGATPKANTSEEEKLE